MSNQQPATPLRVDTASVHLKYRVTPHSFRLNASVAALSALIPLVSLAGPLVISDDASCKASAVSVCTGTNANQGGRSRGRSATLLRVQTAPMAWRLQTVKTAAVVPPASKAAVAVTPTATRVTTVRLVQAVSTGPPAKTALLRRMAAMVPMQQPPVPQVNRVQRVPMAPQVRMA